MKKTYRIVLFLLALLPGFASAQGLMIAAGAGYRAPLLEIYKGFATQTGIAVEPVFSNMRGVLAQLRRSGHIDLAIGQDVFLKTSPELGRLIPLGRGTLVLAYAKGVRPGPLARLAETDIGRIGLPNQGAVYGRMADAALRGAKLYAEVESKLIRGATVPQIGAYLLTREIDAGFINLSEAHALGTRIGSYREVDRALYPPIRIVAGVAKGHDAKPEVQAFLKYLRGDKVRAVLKRYGLL